MTKRNMLLSLASGKLGDMVFYRAGGEQRTRTRVVPKNPKTIAQMNQRLRMLNPTCIYGQLSSVLKASFTERNANQSSANKFMSEAVKALPWYISKGMKEAGFCIPFGAKVAQGNIGVSVASSVKPIYIEKNEALAQAAAYDCLFYLTPAIKAELFPVPEVMAGFDSFLSNGLFGKALRDALKIAVPENFTISVIAGVSEVLDEDRRNEGWKLGIRQYIVRGEDVTDVYSGCAEAADYTYLHAAKTKKDGNDFSIYAGKADTDGIAVAKVPTAIIVSFEQDGKLFVTTSAFPSEKETGTTASRNFLRYYKEGGSVYVQAMEEYGYSTGSALNSQVLNTTEEPDNGSDADGDGFEE